MDSCRWCGLKHLPGGPSRTKEWISCREALGNEIVRLTKKLKVQKQEIDLQEDNNHALGMWMDKYHNEVPLLKEERVRMAAKVKIFRDGLQLIHDLAIDYDGYREAKNLMGLIDELKAQAKKALNYDR